jgi:hypothetical protein
MDLSEIKTFEEETDAEIARKRRLRLAQLLREADERGVRQCTASFCSGGAAPFRYCALGAAYLIATRREGGWIDGERVRLWAQSALGSTLRESVLRMNDQLGMSFSAIAESLERANLRPLRYGLE